MLLKEALLSRVPKKRRHDIHKCRATLKGRELGGGRVSQEAERG